MNEDYADTPIWIPRIARMCGNGKQKALIE
jgi:hypothetical protein